MSDTCEGNCKNITDKLLEHRDDLVEVMAEILCEIEDTLSMSVNEDTAQVIIDKLVAEAEDGRFE
jgi:hypothetical protein